MQGNLTAVGCSSREPLFRGREDTCLSKDARRLPGDGPWKRRANRPAQQAGFSLIELLIVVAIILIIAAISVPNLLRSRMAASEASAVGSLRTINTACIAYSTTFGGFPPSLASLGTSGPASSTSADLIDNVLAGGTKSGYSFTYTPGGAASGVIPVYNVTASPLVVGQTGQRFFFTDQSAVIRFNVSALASASDTPLQ